MRNEHPISGEKWDAHLLWCEGRLAVPVQVIALERIVERSLVRSYGSVRSVIQRLEIVDAQKRLAAPDTSLVIAAEPVRL